MQKSTAKRSDEKTKRLKAETYLSPKTLVKKNIKKVQIKFSKKNLPRKLSN